MGASPAERLAWVIGFAALDLDAASPHELAAFGYDLREFAMPPAPAGQSRGVTFPVAAMPVDDLRAYQAVLRGILLDLAQGRGWMPPAGPPAMLQLFSPADSGRLQFYRFSQLNDEREAILLALDEALRACDRICRCPECGWPFVKEHRQQFCSKSCQQRDQDRRRHKVKTAPAFVLRRPSRGKNPKREG